MTFTLQDHPPREKIGEIHVQLEDPDGSNPKRSVRASIRITTNTGRSAGNWNGDLLPHLPPEHIGNLIAVLDWLRAQAEEQLLP